ncbi:RTA1 like protein-domain-containing protein [Pyrenochaeta sp. MPI-SDFR-AT-0127]|nr:RTA1 like protein-domain-containing protein [Pyrenochaeta sp. MPI-SDFR-AT-0127]
MIGAPSLVADAHAGLVNLPKRAAVGYSQNFLNPYIYDPSEALAIVGAILIVLLSIFSIYQFIRHRSWFFWAAIIAVLMLALGFICRMVSAFDEQKDLPFLVAWLMILLAPSFLAAACYTAFSRVVWFSCPTYALNFKTLWCFPRWITPTFVIFDLFSFLIQLVGASQISRQYDKDSDPSRSIESSERKALPGRIILILGLVLQMLCFFSFSIISMRYFYISRHWRADDLGDMKLWRKLSYTINLSSIIIALRAIYRTMEIPHDQDYGLKYLQSNEWCFWTFDAVPILAVLVVFALWHPGRYLPRSYTGLALDKGRAMKEKDELNSMAGTAQQETELRDFKPEDFQNGRVATSV